MNRPIFGLETEIAFNAESPLGRGRSRGEWVKRFMQFIRTRTPHLRDGSSQGFFIQNGARVYLDSGDHPEFTTPECSSPGELVRYQAAGEQWLGGLLEAYRDSDPDLTDCTGLLCNVDYQSATFGSHESYLCKTPVQELAPHLIPHLVSRLIYTGAGGFDPEIPGMEFTLSPRAFYIQQEISSKSMTDRGLVHTKDEPLCRGYRRLHLLCGESLASQTASWLRIGATALIVALMDAGRRPGDAVRLRMPLTALRVFARDPTCSAAVPIVSGGMLTAVQIQRHYLEMVERHLDADNMPAWAGTVCREWRRILDRICQGGPDDVVQTLDWAIKYALFQDMIREAGMTWTTLAYWNHVYAKLIDGLSNCEAGDRHVSIARLLSADSPIPNTIRNLAPYLVERGLQWRHLGRYLMLRGRLLESDMRFAQLGSRGIFRALDRAGVLEHRMADVGNIDAAVDEPPATGRAAARGRMVRELHGHPERYECSWDGIMDCRENRVFDLSDPFDEQGRWQNREKKNVRTALDLDTMMAIIRESRQRMQRERERTDARREVQPQ